MTNTFGSRSTGLAPSRDAAFVVHLTDAGGEAGDRVHGRVEHVTTGRATDFDSMDELLRFMRQTLATIDRDDPR